MNERSHFELRAAEHALDPEKRYNILRTIFKNVIQHNVQTTAVLNSHQLFKDMVLSVHPSIKNALTGRKNDADYIEQKL